MKAAYGFLGVVFVLIVGATYVLLSGEEKERATPLDDSNTTVTMLTLTSPAFEAGGLIPSKYTCDGENISPPLVIDGIPENSETLVLLMDDPDIPESVKEGMGIEKFDHWIVYGMPPSVREIQEGAIEGSNGYTGPCPPDGEHRYFFRLYAVDATLNFFKAPTLDEVRDAIEGHIIEEAELMGRYERVQ